MSRPQLKLFKQDSTSFGGSLFTGNAREKRPFSRKCLTHVVMRSRHAVGSWSMLQPKNKKYIDSKVRYFAKKFYVNLKRFENVGNHLHIVIQAPTREAQANFLRTISALISRQVMGAHKGSPTKIQKFWDAKPFTKLVKWAVQYPRLMKYMAYNSLEAIGFSKQGAKEYLALFSSS
ncbi:MAG: transposase [Bdellovibrionales bacterium]